MAEAFLNHQAGDQFEAESAGLEPTEINPLVIEVMKEIGIDISMNRTDSVFDFFKQGRLYRLCDYRMRRSKRRTVPALCEPCNLFPLAI